MKEGDIMNEKKFTTVSGTLLFPLRIGGRTVILHDGGYTWTSKVAVIHSVQPGDIRFETENTYYRLLLPSVSQTADCRPVLRMAA